MFNFMIRKVGNRRRNLFAATMHLVLLLVGYLQKKRHLDICNSSAVGGLIMFMVQLFDGFGQLGNNPRRSWDIMVGN